MIAAFCQPLSCQFISSAEMQSAISHAHSWRFSGVPSVGGYAGHPAIVVLRIAPKQVGEAVEELRVSLVVKAVVENFVVLVGEAMGRSAEERQKAYRELLRRHLDAGQIGDIRTALNERRVYGSERFKDVIEATPRRQVWRGKAGRPKKPGKESDGKNLSLRHAVLHRSLDFDRIAL